MTYVFDPSLIWYVCFHEGRAPWAKRFRHVSLMGHANDTWVYIDMQRRGVSVQLIYHHDDVQWFWNTVGKELTVVKFGPARAERAHFMRPMTCVSFAKHVLGIRSSALLPDGLFRSLTTKHECEVMNDPL